MKKRIDDSVVPRKEMYARTLDRMLRNNEKVKASELISTFDAQVAVGIARTLRTEIAKMSCSHRSTPVSRVHRFEDFGVDNATALRIVRQIYGICSSEKSVEVLVARKYVETKFIDYMNAIPVCAPPGCRRDAKGRAVCGKCGKVCLPTAWLRHMKCWAAVVLGAQ